jgi:hypothetical protein
VPVPCTLIIEEKDDYCSFCECPRERKIVTLGPFASAQFIQVVVGRAVSFRTDPSLRTMGAVERFDLGSLARLLADCMKPMPGGFFQLQNHLINGHFVCRAVFRRFNFRVRPHNDNMLPLGRFVAPRKYSQSRAECANDETTKIWKAQNSSKEKPLVEQCNEVTVKKGWRTETEQL